MSEYVCTFVQVAGLGAGQRVGELGEYREKAEARSGMKKENRA